MKLNIRPRVHMGSVVNFLTALLVFILMLDPSGSILNLKIPLFILLTISCAITFRTTNHLINLCFLVYGILGITTLFGFFFNYDTNYMATSMFYKNFAMIWLLPWVNHLRIIEYLKFPAFIISIVVITAYIIIAAFPQIEVPLYMVMTSDRFENTVMMSRRIFLGIPFISVYYTSAPVLLLLFAVMFRKYLFSDTSSVRTLFYTLLIACSLFMGGTRAIMLSVIAIFASLLILKSWSTRKGKIISIYMGFTMLIAGIFTIHMLLNDSQEESLSIKNTLVESIYEKIGQNPETLIWGHGIGATFDSKGIRGTQATISELLYLEFIRWFGIPLSVLLLLCVYIYPLYLLYHKRKVLPYATAIMLGYVFYLLLAGTNPYLLASNGFLTLLIVYSYALNSYYEHHTV